VTGEGIINGGGRGVGVGHGDCSDHAGLRS
jgi:hypothetical protein